MHKEKHMSVVVYTKPGCPQCTATKRKLAGLHVPHRSVDVTGDPAARATVVSLGYTSLPVVLLPDGRHWSGFSPDRIAELANAKAA
ncbi:glutaredoxin family protein [Mycobacteroides abscessus]